MVLNRSFKLLLQWNRLLHKQALYNHFFSLVLVNIFHLFDSDIRGMIGGLVNHSKRTYGQLNWNCAIGPRTWANLLHYLNIWPANKISTFHSSLFNVGLHPIIPSALPRSKIWHLGRRKLIIEKSNSQFTRFTDGHITVFAGSTTPRATHWCIRGSFFLNLEFNVWTRFSTFESPSQKNYGDDDNGQQNAHSNRDSYFNAHDCWCTTIFLYRCWIS